MNTRNFNNFFGDMDLFLMDLILKGKVPDKGKVLDVGCGDGRNGIYFIQHGYEYHGWDSDASRLQLLKYLAKSLDVSKACFDIQDLRNTEEEDCFDLIICSRVLHFAQSSADFFNMWSKLSNLLRRNGLLYVTMDSAIDNNLGTMLDDGKAQFPDAKVRFVLTHAMYEEIKKGFEEIEPLRTLVHHNERAQSFLCLKKV